MSTKTSAAVAPGEVRRFDTIDRVLHVALMISFLGLSLTGLPLLFSDRPWAAALAKLLGGAELAGLQHRAAAGLMLVCFATHLLVLGKRIFVERRPGMLWGPGSLVPQPRDALEMYAHFRWFVGLGPRPHFGRYTYWQKFDYWAVFWGMGIIGTSGLIMWFPGVATTVLPGWILNLVLLIHGEEALLAMIFIFTVHFFNELLRPEKIFLDPVIFTGRLTIEELETEHPAEYEELVRTGRLDARRVGPGAPWIRTAGRVLAGVAVLVGWTIVGLSINALLRGH